MAYVIEYFNDGKKVGQSPWGGTLQETIAVARDGLIRHRADFYRIIDDNSLAEVESGRRDA